MFRIKMLVLFLNCMTSGKMYYIKIVSVKARYYSKIAVIPENWDNQWISAFAYRALITEMMDTVLMLSNAVISRVY